MDGLNHTYETLAEEIGFALGYGSDPSRWDAMKKRRIDAAIREGLHKFLYNSALGGKVYRWSFMRQTFPFTTAADVYIYALPEDYGSQEAAIFYDDENWRAPIKMVNEAQIDRKRSLAPESSGPPVYAAVRARPAQGAGAQRFEVVVFPTPDGAYNLRLPYQVNGDMLSLDRLYPLGGPPVARAILMACKSEAFLQTNDDHSWEEEYAKSLLAAINYDSARLGPTLGYNGDNSDRREMGLKMPQNIYLVSHEGVYSDEAITLADL